MNNLQSVPAATAYELLMAALQLKAYSVAKNALEHPQKVFPQVSIEKSFFKFAVIQHFQDRNDLSDAERKEAGDYAAYYQDGFRQLLGEMTLKDPIFAAQIARKEFLEAQEHNTFVRSSLYIESGGKVYQLAASRKWTGSKNADGEKIYGTNICFVERTLPVRSTDGLVEKQAVNQAIANDIAQGSVKAVSFVNAPEPVGA